MIGLLATLPFSRITLRVAMETMHFHTTKTGLVFYENFISHSGVPINNLASMRNCPGGCEVSQIRHGEILATKMFLRFLQICLPTPTKSSIAMPHLTTMLRLPNLTVISSS